MPKYAGTQTEKNLERIVETPGACVTGPRIHSLCAGAAGTG